MNPIQKDPITKQTAVELAALKPASEIMPLTVGSGDREYTYTGLTVSCIECGEASAANIFMAITGTVANEEGVQVNCVKACKTCRLASRYIFRLYPDGYATQILPNGALRAYKMKKTRKTRLIELVSGLCLKLLFPFSKSGKD